MVACAHTYQSYLRDNGMRLGQLFERMVAWARDASEEDLIMHRPGILTLAQHVNTCVPIQQRVSHPWTHFFTGFRSVLYSVVLRCVVRSGGEREHPYSSSHGGNIFRCALNRRHCSLCWKPPLSALHHRLDFATAVVSTCHTVRGEEVPGGSP